MKVVAQFGEDIADVTVQITLRGSMREFSELSSGLLNNSANVPYYLTRPLIDAINDASRKLASRVDVDLERDIEDPRQCPENPDDVDAP